MEMKRASIEEIESVYRRRGEDFLRFALARTGDRERALDAVQDGFARSIRNRHKFRGSGPLEAWIARCVINAANDVRANAIVSDRFDNAGGPTAGAVDATTLIVREAVLALPQRQRDALFLRHYLDLDYAAIAAALGVEVGTVSATLHAARSTLANVLQEVPL
jgi:RNA polymerase sigma factor (sigma-70 family)